MSLAERWGHELRAELGAAVELRHRLHADPRVSGDEVDTCAELVHALGMGPGRAVAGTGRIVDVPATGCGATRSADVAAIALRTELDGLPVVEATGASWASGNGVMHACGHDVHMAALVAVCRAATRLELPVPLVALLQPREEGAESGARDVVAEGALDTVGDVIAAHVQPQLSAGVVGVTPGAVNADSTEFTIVVRGKGGHSGYPHIVTDSVLALSSIVVALQQVAARRIDPVVGAACMVTRLAAGTANNVVPDSATASGTVRAMRVGDHDTVRAAIVEIATHVAAAHGCRAEVSFAEGEPILVNDALLATSTSSVLAEMGHQPSSAFRSFGSDDFAHYCLHARGLMMFVGTGAATGGLHDASFLPPDDYVAVVADALVAGYCAAASSRPPPPTASSSRPPPPTAS